MEIEKTVDAAGEELIEVSQNGSVIARIYPQPSGIRIVSDYLDSVERSPDVGLGVVVRFTAA